MDSKDKSVEKKKQQKKEENQGEKDDKDCHVRVYLRTRPMSSKEKKESESEIVKAETARKEIQVVSKGKKISKIYNFDGVFGPEQSQKDVYDEVAAPIVEEALKGYNCTIFCYGQTGLQKKNRLLTILHTYQKKKELERLSPWRGLTKETPSSLQRTKIVE